MLFPDGPLKPCVMFATKAVANPSEATNITLGWKGMTRKNTLAYYEH